MENDDMLKKMFVYFIAVIALVAFAPVVHRDIQPFDTNVVHAKGNNVWFYSSSGLDYWLTKVSSEGNGVYTASVTAKHNGQFHQLYVYKVKSENGLAYSSKYDRSDGTWSSWYHDGFAQAMWRGIQDYF
ncbi:MAG: hypothetical protein K6C05_05250 [Anaerovibrio sp.]|nr:hypothetical protein [Anaerovibrio sp.]